MSQARLLLFLSDVEGNLTALRGTLKRVCEAADVALPELTWATPPQPLAEAGWHVAEVRPAQGSAPAAPSLEAHLEAAAEALAQDFRDRALGLFADRDNAYGRVVVAAPGRPAKVVEGELLDVLRQAARWLDVEAGSVARLVGNGPRNELAAAVDFGQDPQGAPARPAPEPDEDDRFVAAKLAEARALMQRWLDSRQK